MDIIKPEEGDEEGKTIERLTTFDITNLAGRLQWVTTLGGQPGRLTFTLQNDPKNQLQIAAGDRIALYIRDVGKFKGYVFTRGIDAKGTIKVTCYDQLRYWKNADTRYVETGTATDRFFRMCEEFGMGENTETGAPASYQIKAVAKTLLNQDYYENETLYSILDDAIIQTNIAEALEGRRYIVRDVFGVLTFTELKKEHTGIVLGDNSAVTGYTYEVDIDRDTYNHIKVVRTNNLAASVVIRDPLNVKKWGKLQYLYQVDQEQANPTVMEDIARKLLDWKNSEKKKLKLNVMGTMTNDDKVDMTELQAGSGFRLRIEDLGIEEDFWITAATHNFAADVHTLDLEVQM